jgi:hypothetical protein
MRLLALLLLPSLAFAGPVENMRASCEQVMAQGACRVALDAKDYPNPTILISRIGRISTASYLRIRGMGDAKNPDGSYQMCSVIPTACSVWDSDDCKAVRALWRQ